MKNTSTSATPTRVGVRLPVTGVAATSENITSVARWAHRLGFASLWGSEHIVTPLAVAPGYPGTDSGQWPYPPDMNWLAALPALLWAGAAAPGCELGTCVVVAPLYQPVLLAKHAATMNFLCGERLILGVGVGWMQAEFQAVGAEFEHRGPRMTEAIALMRALWSGDPVTFDGDFYQVRDVQMRPAPRSGSIPVLCGGRSRAAIRRVVRTGDGWIPDCRSIPELRLGIAALNEECQRADRDPASIRIVFKPGAAFGVTAADLADLDALGVDDLVIDPPLRSADLEGCLPELERVAGLLASHYGVGIGP
jgi:probable F420-dependent oxidoreductase